MQKNIMTRQFGFTSLVVISLLLCLSACTKDIGIASEADAGRNPTQKAAALTGTQSVFLQEDIVASVPCANNGAGEDVVFSGAIHALIHVTINDNGATIKTHFQPQGLKGVGLSTGDIYNATGVTQDTETGSFVNGSYSYNYVNSFKIIGPGPGNNLLIQEVLKITVNASGEVTVAMDKSSVACK